MSTPEGGRREPGRRRAATPAEQRAHGRGRGRRPTPRLDLTVVAAVVVPVLALVAALLVHADADGDLGAAAPPAVTALTRSDVICPDGGGRGVVATTTDESGDVAVRLGDVRDDLGLAPRTPVDVPGTADGGDDDPAVADDDDPGAFVVTGSDALAPGLVAGSFSSPLAAADCGAPVFDQWFTGVGAGPKHASVLELVNPDAGRAIVDVEVLGSDGLVDAPELRGIAVPGGATVRVDLAAELPRPDELALRVQTVRGRVSVHVADGVDRLDTAPRSADWLAGQDAPRRVNLLLGLAEDAGRQVLVLANPGTTEGRATLRLVTTSAVFTPTGAQDVVLPPQSVVRVSVSGLIATARRDAGRGDAPVGLQVESSVAATASLRTRVDDDLVHATPAPGLADAGSALLPELGAPDAVRRLVLGGAVDTGRVTVSTWDDAGDPLPDAQVDVAPGQAGVLDLPAQARLVTVRPGRTGVGAVVLLVGRDGAAMVRLHEPPGSSLVASVRPGLP